MPASWPPTLYSPSEVFTLQNWSYYSHANSPILQIWSHSFTCQHPNPAKLISFIHMSTPQSCKTDLIHLHANTQILQNWSHSFTCQHPNPAKLISFIHMPTPQSCKTDLIHSHPSPVPKPNPNPQDYFWSSLIRPKYPSLNTKTYINAHHCRSGVWTSVTAIAHCLPMGMQSWACTLCPRHTTCSLSAKTSCSNTGTSIGKDGNRCKPDCISFKDISQKKRCEVVVERGGGFVSVLCLGVIGFP